MSRSRSIGGFGRTAASLVCVSAVIGFLDNSVARADFTIKLTNKYAAQQTSFYCGPASGQMMLNSNTVNLTPLPSQDNIYNKAQAANDPGGNFYTDPIGLRSALAFYDPPANGRTYIAYAMSNYDAANRTIAYNLTTYLVPASAMVGNTAHWIDIYSAKMSSQPALTGPNANFTVSAFYAKDPWTGYYNSLTAAQKVGKAPGLGTDVEMKNTADGSGLWNKYFIPVPGKFAVAGKPVPAYIGKYAFVTDPSEDDAAASSAPAFTGSTVPNGSVAMSDAGTDIASDNNNGGDSNLAIEPAFQNGAFSSNGEAELTDSRGGNDWVVPYYQNTNPNAPTGVALIDPATGGLEGAIWDSTLSGLNLSAIENTLGSSADLVPDDNVVPEPATAALALILFTGAMLPRRRAHAMR